MSILRTFYNIAGINNSREILYEFHFGSDIYLGLSRKYIWMLRKYIFFVATMAIRKLLQTIATLGFVPIFGRSEIFFLRIFSLPFCWHWMFYPFSLPAVSRYIWPSFYNKYTKYTSLEIYWCHEISFDTGLDSIFYSEYL